MEKISVVISTFNRCSLLNKTLIALSKQTLNFDQFEIIVCDSHSTDGTSAMISDFIKNENRCKLTHLHTTNSVAAKRNLGILNSTYPTVVLLDDDCVPREKFLSTHVEMLHDFEPEDLFVLCGETRYPKRFVESSNYYKFRDSMHFGFEIPYSRVESLDFKSIVTMNMSFYKDSFIRNIGQLDETFIGYGAEDIDLGWRMRAKGYRILPCKAAIDHYEMTGSISAYGSKIRRASRDGMNTLLRVNPEAAFRITALKKLEKGFPNRTLADWVVLNLVTPIAVFGLHKPLEWWLEQADQYHYLYTPGLYRFLMGIYHVQGARQRHSPLTAAQAQHSWES